MRISVVIPLYNRRELVCKTLDSLKNQTAEDWECLIVDDGSDDGSFETVQEKYVAKDGRFRLFRRPENVRKGACACRNIGLDQAKGEYIYFFDSDDLLVHNFMESVSEEIRKYPEADYFQIPYLRFDTDSGEILSLREYLPGHNGSQLLEKILTIKIPFSTPFYIWKKKLLIEGNIRWPEQLLCRQDFVCYYSIFAHLYPQGRQILGPTLTLMRHHKERMMQRHYTELPYALDHLEAYFQVWKEGSQLKERKFVRKVKILVLYNVITFPFLYRGTQLRCVIQKVADFFFLQTSFHEKCLVMNMFVKYLLIFFRRTLFKHKQKRIFLLSRKDIHIDPLLLKTFNNFHDVDSVP